ncbi:peroxisomal 2,4-dienoyl-CoA reductase [(3E)-enoyl-CoA-producing] isoform X2 [Rattus norvegicus]|uniref:peroxisomal 2,4-dienoyl-CoA reductase [(3E)-enoyl-CoA-producing] isoform X2 n=1 Tax=Rattus norvegicus TaxID=10116 RepID=UPI0019170206|nr:peroxisomal 2,4-dienoyl-CoA reductase [(3E)-enoyl-CoA-producing] isoform X2 [Rattus norvegicus]XP_038942723.1 peroxisomal 2,4-dienoyl-CoA reductase [(3E)-enoyl-CoA-producing] isoform X2 [Rattus norvegicus]
MTQQPPDVEEDDCLSEYHHLFCPDLLQDKVAFITGGGSGIGFRIAEIFMRHGCHTVIVSRSLPRVSEAAKKLVAATGKRCLPLSMDVRVPPAVMAAVDQALKEFGKIDILINYAMTRHLAVEWGPQNIRVNSLAPGAISGTEGLRRLGGPKASSKFKYLSSPIPRLGTKTEIAHSVLYLASPLASYVSGIVLVVDGGSWMTLPNDIGRLLEFESSSAKL